MLVDFTIFFISLAVLLFSADEITKDSAHIARALGVSEFIIGATVVAFGTSLPELSSALSAIQQGFSDIAISMVIGSNVANIALVTGITAAVFRIAIHRDVLSTDVPFLIASTIALIIVMIDGAVTMPEGLLLIIMYLAFVNHSIRHPTKGIIATEQVEKIDPRMIGGLLVGIVLLFFGARYLISSATNIMVEFDLSGTFVGFLFIAIGTSLPEVLTTFTAAKQGLGDIAIGNVIGSNTFNSLMVVGIGSLLTTIPVSQEILVLALEAMFLLTVLLGFSLMKSRITRFEGLLYILLYIIILISLLGTV